MSEENVIKGYLSIWQDVLNSWYHSLTRVIRPPCFFSYLRAHGVFTQDDQEVVENTYVTTAMKAGCLIDIIMRKGENGFIAFMEVIEYSYPELFNTLTNYQARPPPKSYNSAARASTTDYLLEFVSSLQDSIKERRDKLEHLQNTIHVMRSEFDKEVGDLKNQIEILTRGKEQALEELRQMKKGEEDQKNLYAQSLINIESERKQSNQWKKRCTTIGIQALEAAKEGTNASQQIGDLEQQFKAWRQDNDQWEAISEQLRIERDMHKKLAEDFKQKYESQVEMNKKLESECHVFTEKYREVVEIMEKLENEIKETSKEFNPVHYSMKLKASLKPVKSDEKRMCTFQSTNVPPLVIYFPKEFKVDVGMHLASVYEKYPLEVVSSKDEVAELDKDPDALLYMDASNHHQLIRISKLKKLEKTVLLDISVEKVALLMKAGVRPVVIVVKFLNKKAPSWEESFMNKEKLKYHVIKIKETLKNDPSQLFESIIPEVKSYVDD